MGGGDLNLKKSWHPQTLKNQEKVWKAEQAEMAEKRRLHELKKEIAEEKNREDLKKLGQASGVLAQTSDNPKLEWMYKGPTDLLNREEYLLGRAIDKSFEQLDAEEKAEKEKQVVGVTVPKNHVEHECIPFSIRQYRSIQSSEQVDLQRKIMEDPLMMIKQKELESRRKILENPVKLKELHRLLKSEKVSKTEKKKKSKKEKKKKDDKKRKGHGSDETSDEELDKMLAKQYKKIQSAFGDGEDSRKLDINKLLKVKYDKLSKELDRAAKSKKKKKSRSSSSSSNSSNSSVSSSDDKRLDKKRFEERRPAREYKDSDRKRMNRNPERPQTSRSGFASPEPPRNRINRNTEMRQRNRSRSKSPEFNRSRMGRNTERRQRSRSTSRSPGLMRSRAGRNVERRQRSRSKSRSHEFSRNRTNRNSEIRQKSRSRSRSPRRRSTDHRGHSPIPDRRNTDRNRSPPREAKPAQKGRLTEEEKERRRLEMMQNAVWRDEERTRSVKKYREEYEKERAQHESAEFDRTFINKELQKAMSNQKSVESRIRSNINNIQRSSRAMDSNFAKR